MLDKQDAGDKQNLSKSTDDDKYLPIDPGQQSEVGLKIETPIVKRDEGISEQSAKWEDAQERGGIGESIIPEEAEQYIKDPSPEEMAHDDNKDKKDWSFMKDGERTPPENNPEDINNESL
ncbi:hypothetical protein [Aridibaculum aurantiacum]|uniref:hypothetical protein n=1 Tax=Aridibaculum aurantiacum TaxID=2810307 RepID=UPI001A973B59|nr:hypothetical protein [Aridibaculum aurantiacum]